MKHNAVAITVCMTGLIDHSYQLILNTSTISLNLDKAVLAGRLCSPVAWMMINEVSHELKRIQPLFANYTDRAYG